MGDFLYVAFLLLTKKTMPLPLLAAAGIKAIPAVAGLIGNLFDKPRRTKEEQKASSGISNLTDIFKAQLGQDYFSSPEGLATLKQIEEESDDNLDDINATANVNGLTDEARIALMGQNMRAKQGALSGLSGQASLWRQRTLQQYGGSLQNLFSVGMNNRRNTQNNVNNLTGGMQTAIDGAFNVGAFDGLLGGQQGSSFNPMSTGAVGGMANAFQFLKG